MFFTYRNILIFFITIIYFNGSHAFAQITFDYSGAELVIKYFTGGDTSLIKKIADHPGYRHIFDHSARYSSNPLTVDNLINSLCGKNEGFNFSGVKAGDAELAEIIRYLKSAEQEIIENYAKLPLTYLPHGYKQKAEIYFVIGGYNGIAFDDKICININYAPFRENYNEIKLYLAHELFHVGFEKYQPLPDLFKAKTVSDLTHIVRCMTMNEGLATLTPWRKRIEMKETGDYDYIVLLNADSLLKKEKQFETIAAFLQSNASDTVTNDILGMVLGQCSGDRLFYIIGCKMGLEIEKKFGAAKISELIAKSPDDFFDLYDSIMKNK